MAMEKVKKKRLWRGICDLRIEPITDNFRLSPFTFNLFNDGIAKHPSS